MFEEVAAIIAEQFGVDVGSITAETAFETDLGADSIDIVELSMALEDAYPIGQMSEDDITSITTVGDLIQYLQAHVEED